MVLPNSEPSVTSSDGCRTRVNFKRSNYLWVIDDYKAVHDKRSVSIDSLPFSADDDKFKWQLTLNPRGDNNASIVLYLFVIANDGDLSKYIPITGILKASVMNAENQPKKAKSIEFTIPHGSATTYTVVPSFVEKSYLFTEANQLLPQDRLTISCEISYVKKTDIVNIPGQSFSTLHEKDQSAGLEDIETMFMDEEFADITLCVNGKDYPAHKSIIVARSLYFRTLLRTEMTEKKSNRVDITETNESVFEEVLRYIYTGKVQNLDTLVSELLEAADRFNLEKLKNICAKEMLKNISKENAIDILILADRHNAADLKIGAKQFIKINFFNTNLLTEEIQKDLVKSYPQILLEILDAIRPESI